MNIPWKLKSFIFMTIDILRFPSLLYFLQKNVTGRSRISSNRIDPIWERHKNILLKHKKTKYIFEFGAGKSLSQNIYLSTNVEKQLVVDLYPMIELGLVNQSIEFFIK